MTLEENRGKKGGERKVAGLEKRFGEMERQVREEEMKRKEESEGQGEVSEGFGGGKKTRREWEERVKKGGKLEGRLEEARTGGRIKKKDQGSIGQEQQVRLERGGEFKKIVVEVRQAR